MQTKSLSSFLCRLLFPCICVFSQGHRCSQHSFCLLSVLFYLFQLFLPLFLKLLERFGREGLLLQLCQVFFLRLWLVMLQKILVNRVNPTWPFPTWWASPWFPKAPKGTREEILSRRLLLKKKPRDGSFPTRNDTREPFLKTTRHALRGALKAPLIVRAAFRAPLQEPCDTQMTRMTRTLLSDFRGWSPYRLVHCILGSARGPKNDVGLHFGFGK